MQTPLSAEKFRFVRKQPSRRLGQHFFQRFVPALPENTTFARTNYTDHLQSIFTMKFPSNLKYTKEHEWLRVESGNVAYIGITDFAQSELGELVYIEVETVGETVEADAVFGTVEAVKTTSELFMPVTGKVLEFNEKVSDKGDPALVNEDPYGEGWIIKVEVSNPADLDKLLNTEEYEALVG